jgi:hypothetical protein
MSPFDLDVKQQIGFLPERPCYNRWMTIRNFWPIIIGLLGGQVY